MKKKKNRELQPHKPSSSAAVHQLKQADKESSVEAEEEKTATVDTTEGVEEEEDKKPAAVQRIEPNEVAQLGQEEGDSLLLEDILLALGYGKSGKRECSPKSSAFVDGMETPTVAATNQLCKQYGKK